MSEHTHTTELTRREAVEALMSKEGGVGVIDFWAPWCGPCRTLAPQFAAVAEEYAEQPVTFYKLNTEAHPALSKAFNVRALPTLLFVHDGEIMDAHIGVISRKGLIDKVELLLSKARGESFWDRLIGRRKE